MSAAALKARVDRRDFADRDAAEVEGRAHH
jgi:hypothetical protein